MAVDRSKIEGVKDEELQAVAGSVAALPNLHGAPAERFAQAVRGLVERRAQSGWPDEGGADVAVFVLVAYPREVGERCGGTPFLDPMAQGTPLLGRVFFSSLDASHGQFIEMPTEVGSVHEWLERKGLGACAMVFVYRNSGQMVTRPGGIEGVSKHDTIREEEPSVTVEEVLAALRYYHRRRVVTPRECPDGVWRPGCAGRYIPGQRPERSIQRELQVVLSSWFRDLVRAEAEDNTNIGRIDVRLLRQFADGGLAYWVILELKVIKSYTYESSRVSESANVEAIVKGVRQAAAFGADRGAEAMLEIYDLRRDKSEDLVVREAVSEALSECSVPPRVDVWAMYGSAEEAREAGEVS